MIDPANWFLFPASVLIATIAMTTGIGGAVFFSPLFILVLKLDPAVAIGTALITELFGFTSGVYAYWKRKLIDFRLGRMLLMFSIPAAIAGSLAAESVRPNLLKGSFALGIMFIGLQLFSAVLRERRGDHGPDPADESDEPESVLVDAAGREFRYRLCKRHQARAFAAIGGGFLGMISVGLAELQEYHLLVRCRVPPPVAVGTAIFVVVLSVLVASMGHFYAFVTSADATVLEKVGGVVAYTVPGVIIGGQIGPLIQSRMNPLITKAVISFLFFVVGVFMLITVL